MTSFTLPLLPAVANRWGKDSNSVRDSKSPDVQINSGTLRSTLDPVADEVLDLIEEHMTETLDAIPAVGSFYNSPSLQEDQEQFREPCQEYCSPSLSGSSCTE